MIQLNIKVNSKQRHVVIVCQGYIIEVRQYRVKSNLRGFMFRKFVPRFLLGISGQKFSVCYMVYILISGNVSS